MVEAPLENLIVWYAAQPEIVQQAVLATPFVLIAVGIPLFLIGCPSLAAALLPRELQRVLSFWRWHSPDSVPGWLRRLHLDWGDPPLDPPVWKDKAEHAVDTAAPERDARRRFGRR